MWRAARGAAAAQRRLLHGGARDTAAGPGLAAFMPAASAAVGPALWLEGRDAAAAAEASARPAPRVFLESYGCQMNSNDAEVVLSVLAGALLLGASVGCGA